MKPSLLLEEYFRISKSQIRNLLAMLQRKQPIFSTDPKMIKLQSNFLQNLNGIKN